MTRVTGATPNMPLNQIKRMYWTSQTGGADPSVGMGELEKRWLAKLISDNGGTVSNFKSIETLWKEAVAVLGLSPAPRMTENKKNFFSSISS